MPASPRDRRLVSDHRCLTRLNELSSILDFSASGDPPDEYEVRFSGKGLARNKRGDIELIDEHACVIRLGSAYPRQKPDLTWKSRIYHPNISEGGMVCLGGYSMHWVPSLQLDELCEMLWDMVRLANYDTRSAYNYAAAKWLLTQREFAIPVDARPLRDRVASGEVKADSKPQPSPKGDPKRGAATGATKTKKDEDEVAFLDDGGATAAMRDEDILILKDE